MSIGTPQRQWIIYFLNVIVSTGSVIVRGQSVRVTVSVSTMEVVRAKKVGPVKTVKRKCVVTMFTTLLITVLSVRVEAATITFQVKSTAPLSHFKVGAVL